MSIIFTVSLAKFIKCFIFQKKKDFAWSINDQGLCPPSAIPNEFEKKFIGCIDCLFHAFPFIRKIFLIFIIQQFFAVLFVQITQKLEKAQADRERTKRKEKRWI
jgi:hypothetical protein